MVDYAYSRGYNETEIWLDCGQPLNSKPICPIEYMNTHCAASWWAGHQAALEAVPEEQKEVADTIRAMAKHLLTVVLIACMVIIVMHMPYFPLSVNVALGIIFTVFFWRSI